MSRRASSRRNSIPAPDLSGLISDPLRAAGDDILSGVSTGSSAEDTCGKCGGSNGRHLLTCVTRVGG